MRVAVANVNPAYYQAMELAYVRKKYGHLDCVYTMQSDVPIFIQGTSFVARYRKMRL